MHGWHLLAPAGQRHRHRHRHDAASASGSPSSSASPSSSPSAPDLPDPLWLVVGHPAGAGGAARQRAVPRSASSPRSFMWWMFRATRVGLMIRVVGDSDRRRPRHGPASPVIRTLATAAGGAFAGVGGAYLSLYYPGSWNEGISSGQGLMAVALVIFARWNPHRCFWPALLFGGAGALGPALQSVGISRGLLPLLRRPYILTLGVLIAISSKTQAMTGRRASCPSPNRSTHERSRRSQQISRTVSSSAWCSCNCPWSKPPPIWPRRPTKIVAMVGKARRNMGTMDLVVFPEYALHGLSMDTNPDIMCDRRPRGRRLQAGLHRQRHLGLLLDHGATTPAACPTTPASSSTTPAR
jgi:hypothetical protein